MLTSPSDVPGRANADFVIFPPRWMVAEDTFRPPWFHRNVMSECMGLIMGAYDAKAEGFAPGGMSLHNLMAGHGPDCGELEGGERSGAEAARRSRARLAFMVESCWPYRRPASRSTMPRAIMTRPGTDFRRPSCPDLANLHPVILTKVRTHEHGGAEPAQAVFMDAESSSA